MTFANYGFNFHTWTVWTAGLLVKDALTLTFADDNTGWAFTTRVIINYSARGYGKMTEQEHYHLDDRMLEKHRRYMENVNHYRDYVVIPILNTLKGKEFKSVNAFIKEYNKRAYK